MAWASKDSYCSRIVLAYVLLLLAGPFGLHRFYLGRICTGWVWLFTGGLFGVGVAFDFFAIPFMAARVD
ncbi:MAG TPA: TM2 domain-containing protein [Pseudomonadales bacterium]|nr:TM2 domain-containing protein [Pseudomonadales bacterium]